MKLIIGVALLILTNNLLQAQKISGVILDSETKEPLEYANVYFANTVIGTVTNQKGQFFFDDFSEGKYDFIVSFMGYETYFQSIQIVYNEKIDLNINLKPLATSLEEIFILADTSEREQNYKTFIKYFIGTTPASEKCIIANPECIYFYFDNEKKLLYANASEPIIIDNFSLGYKIFYDLKTFELDLEKGKLSFFGIPRFTHLLAKNNIILKRWEKNRKKAYFGSLFHFVKSLEKRKLDSEKFEVQGWYINYNSDKLTKLFLDKRIKELSKGTYAKSNTLVKESSNSADSLIYYLKQKEKLEIIDGHGKRVFTGEEIMNDNIVNFKGILEITYKGAKENMQYPLKIHRDVVFFQSSKLHIFEKLKVYQNGYYEDVHNTFVEGYWSWTGSIADMLPFGYEP